MEKMEQILLVYSLPEETITAIMMLNKNKKAMVHTLDSNTNFFDYLKSSMEIPLHHFYS